jgi:hypothetical protein
MRNLTSLARFIARTERSEDRFLYLIALIELH